jgi:DnaA regulatory inactivator Hda
MSQLLLPLSLPPRFSFETLIVHEGIEKAVAAVTATYRSGPRSAPSLFLHGPPGTGKTHMLRALVADPESAFARHDQGVIMLQPAEGKGCPELEGLIAGAGPETLEDATATVIDDLHLLTDRDEVNLWTLSNILRRTEIPLLVAARSSPEELFPSNPHMLSRMCAGLVLGLEPPEDNVRMLIMDKIARDKNIRVSPDVFRYLITRKSRNIKVLESILELLDRASLERKRRITLPLVKLLEREGVL